jgi:hypothetical protein
MCTKLIKFSLFFLFILLSNNVFKLKIRCIGCSFIRSEKESLVFIFVPMGK